VTELRTAAGVEETLAGIMADLLGHDQVAVGSNFFEDLGANSLVMAHFCARVRKQPDLPSISIRDVYSNPPIRDLAAALEDTATAAVVAPTTTIQDTAAQVSSLQYVACGIAQLLLFLCYGAGAGVASYIGYEWISAAPDLFQVYTRAAVAGVIGFVGLSILPVLAKWTLIGRWQEREFPVWSLTYLRFWIVKALIHSSPMILFVGNPLYVWYLRALGARIGRHVTMLSRSVPVCTDLLTIGAGSVIRRDSYVLGYRAHAGRIQIGRVTLGSNVYVGEHTVLDIDTSMGNGAQLGHTSALQRYENVPPHEHWHGSPAERTDVDYVRVPAVDCGTLRRVGFAAVSLITLFGIWLPLGLGVFYALLAAAPALAGVLGEGNVTFSGPGIWFETLILSGIFAVAFLVAVPIALLVFPRLLNLLIEPGRTYPLYGFYYTLHRQILRATNIKFFKWLAGDSSYIVPYLRRLGYDLSRVEQTGSNFGTVMKHDTPYLSSVGTGTMIADGLSMINADFSSTSFRLSPAAIGPHNFVGNGVAYPAGGRTGDNCLLATKVMIPLNGPVREGVGLLGSPSFEIPRSVERDRRFDHFREGEEFHRRLAAKNRYNLRSMGWFLLMRWLNVFVLVWLAVAAFDTVGVPQRVLVPLYFPLSLAFTTAYYVLVERVITRFRTMQPQLCSIYQPYFWWHERYWKVGVTYLTPFNGTPMKNLMWRLLGVRIGRHVFDDGCLVTERSLTTLGDETTLNVGSSVQCHSQEDGTFKSDRSTVGDGCTVGVGAVVHYGVTMGDGAVLAPDSFLMKGEEVPAHTRWAGNPATETLAPSCQPTKVVARPGRHRR